MSVFRVLQLSDLHLFATPEQELRGRNLRHCFQTLIDSIRNSQPEFDLMVLSGDLAHDECEPTYSVLRELLGNWAERCRMIPGNHDNRDAIRAVFPELVPASGVLTFSVDAADWRLIGLDTHVDDYVPGRLDDEQLEWLNAELQQHADRQVGIFIHHPPIPVGTAWLDEIGLEQPEQLTRLIQSFANVKLCCCGHVHHPTDQQIGHCRFLTAPSTGPQFAPGKPKTYIDMSSPGYRVLEFTSDGFESRIERVTIDS